MCSVMEQHAFSVVRLRSELLCLSAGCVNDSGTHATIDKSRRSPGVGVQGGYHLRIGVIASLEPNSEPVRACAGVVPGALNPDVVRSRWCCDPKTQGYPVAALASVRPGIQGDTKAGPVIGFFRAGVVVQVGIRQRITSLGDEAPIGSRTFDRQPDFQPFDSRAVLEEIYSSRYDTAGAASDLRPVAVLRGVVTLRLLDLAVWILRQQVSEMAIISNTLPACARNLDHGCCSDRRVESCGIICGVKCESCGSQSSDTHRVPA